MRVLTDNRILTSKGEVAKPIYKDQLGDMLEPFDPKYLSNENEEEEIIEDSEKTFFRKLNLITGKLKRLKICPEFYARWSCYKIYKTIGGRTLERFVWVDSDDWTYNFGTAEEALVSDTNVGVVVEEIAKWVGKRKSFS